MYICSVPLSTPTSPHLLRPLPGAEKPGCGGSRCRKRPMGHSTPSEGRDPPQLHLSRKLMHGKPTIDLNPQRKNSRINSNIIRLCFKEMTIQIYSLKLFLGQKKLNLNAMIMLKINNHSEESNVVKVENDGHGLYHQ